MSFQKKKIAASEAAARRALNQKRLPERPAKKYRRGGLLS